MNNSYCWQGSDTYWITSYVTIHEFVLVFFLIYELWLFQVPPGSHFCGKKPFAEANSTLVAGRGPVGLWGWARVILWHKLIDPTIELFPEVAEDSWSDAAKVRLQNSNSCRGLGFGDVEWRFCGFFSIPAVKLGGMKELVYFPAGAGSRIL